MSKEEEILREIVKQFGSIDGKIRVQRARRLWASVEASEFVTVLDFLRVKQGFVICCTITGLDMGEKLGVLYHLARADGIMINVQIDVPKLNPVIKTVTTIFPSSDLYERELVDLLGLKIEGLSDGFRYPLADDWPKDRYPLRKDYKRDPATQTNQAKEG
jgi:Ni,Fe-hydrogenase III component G